MPFNVSEISPANVTGSLLCIHGRERGGIKIPSVKVNLYRGPFFFFCTGGVLRILSFSSSSEHLALSLCLSAWLSQTCTPVFIRNLWLQFCYGVHLTWSSLPSNSYLFPSDRYVRFCNLITNLISSYFYFLYFLILATHYFLYFFFLLYQLIFQCQHS